MGHVNAFAIFLGAMLLAVGVVLVVLILRRLGKRVSQPRSLKPHFLRLGRVAPGDVCPCKQDESSSRSYEQCCRPTDIEKLRREVQEYVWRRWSKRSYGGRRRMRTLEQRLHDYPMPDVVLPKWVAHPEAHTFPIDEQQLRAWSPDRNRGAALRPDPLEDSTIDDVI